MCDTDALNMGFAELGDFPTISTSAEHAHFLVLAQQRLIQSGYSHRYALMAITMRDAIQRNHVLNEYLSHFTQWPALPFCDRCCDNFDEAVDKKCTCERNINIEYCWKKVARDALMYIVDVRTDTEVVDYCYRQMNDLIECTNMLKFRKKALMKF